MKADISSSHTGGSPGAERRSRLDRRWLLLGTVGSVAVAATIAWLLPVLGVPLRPGPLSPGPMTGSVLDDVEVGDRFTYGMDMLHLTGDETAVITDVEIVGQDAGVELLGARVGGLERTELWQLVRTWPPRHPRHDVRPLDTPVPPRGDDGSLWNLFVGMEVTEPGRFVSDGWRITYEVGGRTYRVVIPTQIVICTPEGLTTAGECPFPE